VTENPYSTWTGLQTRNGCLAVPCKTCMAAQGEPCVRSDDKLARWPHKARHKAANLIAWWESFGRDDAEAGS
jgi:hypothetical protein